MKIIIKKATGMEFENPGGCFDVILLFRWAFWVVVRMVTDRSLYFISDKPCASRVDLCTWVEGYLVIIGAGRRLAVRRVDVAMKLS